MPPPPLLLLEPTKAARLRLSPSGSVAEPAASTAPHAFTSSDTNVVDEAVAPAALLFDACGLGVAWTHEVVLPCACVFSTSVGSKEVVASVPFETADVNITSETGIPSVHAIARRRAAPTSGCEIAAGVTPPSSVNATGACVGQA